MYLRRKNSNIEIDYSNSELTSREIKLITSYLQGDINGTSIIFEEALLKKCIELLEKQGYNFAYDEEIEKYIEDIKKEDDSFKDFSLNALLIKNNPNENNTQYLEFLDILRSSMKRRLYDFQARAAYHMAFSVNSCNFSVPGAGKTSIVYGAYTYLKHIRKVNKLLIIGPLSSFGPWKNEFKECFGFDTQIINLSNLNNNSKSKYLLSHKSLINEINFINYEGYTKIISQITSFVDNNSLMIVLDEAHKIKNPDSIRAKGVLEFSKKAAAKIILTGTPIPNGYKDLYNLFEFIWPEKKITGFSINDLSRIHKLSNSEKHINTLMTNIDPFYIRIRKEYLGLPDPIHNDPIRVKMGPLQQEIYAFIADDFLKTDVSYNEYELQNELKKGKLIRLMQSLSNPAIIGESISANIIDFNDSVFADKIINYEKYETPEKFKKVLDLCNMIKTKNEKVIIWATYTSVIHSLDLYLRQHGFQNAILYGSTSNEEREYIIDEFHTNAELTIVIANAAAVAESISLHKVCHNAIYLDKNFNAAQYMQSKDRIHRVGLPEGVITNYYYILAEDTIDKLIHERVLEKERIMLDVIEGNTVPLFDDDFGSNMSQFDIDLIESYLKGR